MDEHPEFIKLLVERVDMDRDIEQEQKQKQIQSLKERIESLERKLEDKDKIILQQDARLQELIFENKQKECINASAIIYLDHLERVNKNLEDRIEALKHRNQNAAVHHITHTFFEPVGVRNG